MIIILKIISEVIIKVVLNEIIINVIIIITIIIANKELIVEIIEINSLNYKDLKKRIITLIRSIITLLIRLNLI